ncbi:nucleotide sugar dehydrogenase [Egicoccus sp. AB-alg2]|uniref:nucleotide sugar dehydrogenase n=1 Tax=Egicoccus sp. AB-alg2 TaxID=3242693 RepID=UPI00359DD2BC
MTRIAVFGLGYVGVVSAAVLADHGHDVVGVDTNVTKVGMVTEGRSPIVEPGLDDLVHRGATSGRLRATVDAEEAVRSSDLSLVCVGTPSHANGSLDLTAVQKVCHQIGATLGEQAEGHVVVVRSTVLPGTTRELVIPTLEQASGRTAGRDFHVCVNPEFLREGSAIRDFHRPPFTLVGATDATAAATVTGLYERVDGEPLVTAIEVAETIKYGCNAWHALKVVFANELGSICKQQGVDSHDVMDILCSDTRLNISSAYLTPGFAFGGSCLPKDLRALVQHARSLDVEAPLLGAILDSNQRHADRAFELVRQAGGRRIGVLGLSFKAGTDDLRESPTVALVERLIGKGYQVRIFDRNVSLSRLQGANRAYIEQEIPHIGALMVTDPAELLEESDVLVVGNAASEFREIIAKAGPEHRIVDLVRVAGVDGVGDHYAGICW